MTIAGRVPYTEAGYTQIKAWLQDPINTALLNGVIDAGVVLSEKQKAELYVEAGEDISEQLFTEGYLYKWKTPERLLGLKGERLLLMCGTPMAAV